MTRTLACFAATLATMLLLDLLWLGLIARPLYTTGIGHLMADATNIPAAALFYAVYAAGLLVFAVLPRQGTPGCLATAGTAAVFGFFAYATYDLTNLATLRDWPVGLSLLDIAWGSAVSAASAAAGKLALDRLAP